MQTILLLSIGGALGTVCRYGLQRALNTDFPSGTLAVNLTGCFLIGVLYAAAQRYQWSEGLRLGLITGFCGGFTTFSAFSLESLQLLQQRQFAAVSLYIISSVVFGLLATFAGYKLASNL